MKNKIDECNEMCVHNKICCCKDCENNLKCKDACEGEEERGCEAECENRLEGEMQRLTKLIDGRWCENHDNDTKEWKNGNRACMAKLAEYENAEEIAGYNLRGAIHGMAGEILRLKDALALKDIETQED